MRLEKGKGRFFYPFVSGKYDLVMALGGAVSQKEFYEQREFAKAILDWFDVSRRKTRVGLIQYGKNAAAVQSLGNSYGKDTVIPLIARMVYSNPGSSLLKALALANDMFTPGKGERSDAKKVLIVFIDSLRASGVAELERVISLLKGRSVRIIFVGFESYVEPSAVKILLGSGRSPVLVNNENKLNSRSVINQVIGQLGKGIFASFTMLCNAF